MLQIILTVAVINDFRTDKIPNWLILSGMVTGFVYNGFTGRLTWYQMMLGIIVPILLCFILFLMHGLGAGDIKLFSVIGCFWPIQNLLLCMILAFLTGGVISISKLLIHKQLRASVSCFFQYFYQIKQRHRIEKYPGRDISERQMHFSVSIYIGFFLTLGVTYGEIFDFFM